MSARPASLGYRARRFVGRHRVPVAVATVALAVVLAVAVVSAQRVTAERDVAQQAAADAEAVAETQGELLRVLDPAFRAEADTSAEAAAPTVTDVVDETLETLEAAYADRPAVLARSLATLAATLYARGQRDRADSLFARALALRQPLARDGDPVVREALVGRGLIARDRESWAEARAFFRRALAIERAHPDVIPAGETSSTELRLASVLSDDAARERQLMRALAEQRATAGADTAIATALAHNELATHYFNEGDYQEAFGEFRVAERIVRGQWGELHPATNTLRGNLSYTSSQLGLYDEAERHARIALDAARRAELGPLREATLQQAIGQALYYQKEYEAAEAALRASLALYERETGPESPEALGVVKSLSSVTAEAGQLAEALALARRVAAVDRAAGVADTPFGRTNRVRIAALRFALGEAEALDALRALGREAPSADDAPLARSYQLRLVGDALREAGDAEAALPLLREALALERAGRPEIHPSRLHARLALGRALAELGRTDEARPHLRAVRGHLRRVTYPSVLDDVDAEVERLLAAR